MNESKEPTYTTLILYAIGGAGLALEGVYCMSTNLMTWGPINFTCGVVICWIAGARYICKVVEGDVE